MTFQDLLGVYRAFWRRDFNDAIMRVDALGSLPDSQLSVRLAVLKALSCFQLGRPDSNLTELKQLFLRLRGVLRFSTAYTIAIQCKHRGDYEGAQKYLLRVGNSLGKRSSLKRFYFENELGNIRLCASYFDEALGHYEKAATALAELNEDESRSVPSLFNVVQLDNTGYTLLLLDRVAEGLSMIDRARECAVRSGLTGHEAECWQDLAFGYGLQGKWDMAVCAAESGLAIESNDVPRRVHRNLLVLLGHAINRASSFGKEQRLQEIRNELAIQFPGRAAAELLSVPDLLMAINLKA